MKLKRINDTYLNSQMSRFATVFKKLNGKASEVAAAAVANNKNVRDGKENNGGGGGQARNNEFGWTDEDIRKRRLMAFVKGIQVTGPGVLGGIPGQMNEFEINVDTFDYDNLTFELQRMSPDGTPIAVGMEHEMTELENHVKITYNSMDEPGQYVLGIKFLGIPVPESPFKIDVRHLNDGINKANAKDVVAYGKGLKKCLAGEITTLQLDTKKAGNGQLAVAIDGLKDMPLCVTESKLGYTIQYVATSVGEFFLRVKLDGKHITGSPFLIKADKPRVAPEGTKNLNPFKRGVLVGSKEKKNDLQP